MKKFEQVEMTCFIFILLVSNLRSRKLYQKRLTTLENGGIIEVSKVTKVSFKVKVVIEMNRIYGAVRISTRKAEFGETRKKYYEGIS